MSDVITAESRIIPKKTAAEIDAEVSRLINDAYKRTESLLRENMDKLDLVALTLMEREKINKNEFIQLMENGFIAEEESKTDDNASDDDSSETSESENAVISEEEEGSVEIERNTTDSGETDGI